MIAVEPPAPIAVVLAAEVAIHRRCSPFENPLFGRVKVQSLFVVGTPPPSHLPRASQTSGLALAMFFIVQGESLGISYLAFYIDVVVLMSSLTSFCFCFWYAHSSPRTCEPENFRKYACSSSCPLY